MNLKEKQARRIEKVEIIKSKKNMSQLFNVTYKGNFTSPTGLEKDKFLLEYLIDDSVNQMDLEIISRTPTYTRREILNLLGSEMKTLEEILKIDESEFVGDLQFLKNRKEQLINLNISMGRLFGDDYELFYYLYGLNGGVGKTTHEW